MAIRMRDDLKAKGLRIPAWEKDNEKGKLIYLTDKQLNGSNIIKQTDEGQAVLKLKTGKKVYVYNIDLA